MSDLVQRLAELKDLLDRGLIEAEDYEREKTALLAARREVGLAGATRVGGELGGATRVGVPEQLGSYRILGELGTGGMGTVLRARHVEEGWARRQGGDVAIKLVHPHLAADPGFRERFFAEAELGRKVQHEGVASVFDVLSEGPWLGTVMSLVEGRSLADCIRPGGLPIAEALELLRPLAAALDHLHGLGIVHRDLKPANVLVRPDGRPVLLDLGIAKDTAAGDGLTGTGTAMGTSGWMAPEQLDAKRVGPEADRYALGLLAYALLAGRMPWPAETSAARVQALKLMGDLEPLAVVRPELPSSVTGAVAAATALDPAARPASCGALVERLAAPPEPPPPPPPPPPKPVPPKPPPPPPPPAPLRRPPPEPVDEPPSTGSRSPVVWGVAALGLVASLVAGVAAWSSVADGQACEAARQVDDIAAWTRYLDDRPEGHCAAEAQERILAIEDERRLAEEAAREARLAERERLAQEAIARQAAEDAEREAWEAANPTIVSILEDRGYAHVRGYWGDDRAGHFDRLYAHVERGDAIPLLLRADGHAEVWMSVCDTDGNAEGTWERTGSGVTARVQDANRRWQTLTFVEQSNGRLDLVSGDLGVCGPDEGISFYRVVGTRL